MSNISNANIGVSIDLNALQPGLDKMFNLIETAVGKMKSALGIDADLKTDKLHNSLNSIGNEAQQTGDKMKSALGVNPDMKTEKLHDSLGKVSGEARETGEKIKDSLGVNPELKTDEAKQGLQGIGKGADEAGSHVKELGNKGTDSINKLLRFEIVKTAIEGIKQAFAGVKEYVMQFVDDFAEADLASEKLRNGLERIKESNFFDSLIKQASDLSKVTPFDDDDITNMQSMLTTFDGISAEAIGKLTPAMLNLASAFAQGGDTGMNLTQVAILFGKAAGAELWSAFKRVGIVMTETQEKMLETTSGMERINVFLEIMAHNGNITAEAFGKTLAGQLQIAKNELKNISESLGQVLAPIILIVIEYLKSFATRIQELPGFLKVLIVVVGALGIALGSLTAVIVVLDVAAAAILATLAAFSLIVVGLGAAIISSSENIEAFFVRLAGGEENVRVLKEEFNYLLDGLKQLWTFIEADFNSALVGLQNEFVRVIEKIFGTSEGSDNLKENVKILIDTALKDLYKILDTLIKTFEFVVISISKTIFKTDELGGASKNAKGGIENLTNSLDSLANKISSIISIAGSLISILFALAKEGYNLNMAFLNFSTWNFSGAWEYYKKSMEDFVGLATTVPDALKNIKDASERYSLNTTRDPNDFTDEENIGAQVLTPPKTGTTTTGSNNSTSNVKGDKTGGDKKDKDPYKEETKNLKELIKLHEDELKRIEKKIELGELTPVSLLKSIELYKKELLEMQGILQKAENKLEVDDKILDLRIQENKYLNLNKGVMGDAIALNKKIIEDEKKKATEKIVLQGRAYEELKNKRIQNEGNAYEIEVNNINNKWNAEDQRINETYADIDVREQLLAENKKARNQELQNANIADSTSLLGMMANGFSTVTGAIGASFGNMWDSVFGEANSLFEILIKNIYSQLIALAASGIFKLIINLLSGGSLGFLSFLKFGGGGYTGDGDPKDEAGVVHKREYVVSERGTTKENLPLLEAMNRGESASRILKNFRIPKFNYSGYSNLEAPVKSTGSNSINVNINGVKVTSKSLNGLTQSDWIKLVHKDILPQIDNELTRLNMPSLLNKNQKVTK